MRYFIFSFVLLSAAQNLVFAQGWQVEWAMLDAPLDSICGGTTLPLDDGTLVKVYHDANSNGPDDNDPMLKVCSTSPCSSGTVNSNSFVVNGGDVDLGVPGGFLSGWDPNNGYIVTYTSPPTPNRIYLRVCFGAKRYVSIVYILNPGINDINMALTDWTCENLPCPGCEDPPQPTNLRASDSTSCSRITLQWHYPDSATIIGDPVDSMFIYRDFNLIGAVRSVDSSYVDSTVSQVGSPPFVFSYQVKARRNCGAGQFGYSSSAANQGSLYPLPPAVIMQRASDDTCGYVRVRWTFSITSGLDSFIIKRNGIQVGTVLGAPVGNRVFDHVTSDTVRGGYTVVPWNHVCFEGTPTAVDSGQARIATSTLVTGITASDGLCQIINISWGAVPNATTYQVYRYNNDGTGELALTPTVSHPTTDFAYTTGFTNGVVYRFKARASNQCGGILSTEYDTGYSVTTPATVSGVSATDSTNCDTVTITWGNITNEAGYKVYRTPASGGTTDTLSSTVPVDCTRFWDLTAVSGTIYNYGVRAFDACCNGPGSSTNSGSRKIAPKIPGSVTATDGTVCNGVVITWANVANEDSFIVFRNGTRIGSTFPNVLTFTDLTADTFQTRYGYTVMACNVCGCSTSVVDSGYRRIRPGLTTGVFASDTACANVFLRWNDLAREDSFKILRNGVRIGATTANDTDFVDATAVVGTTYAYRVSAWNCTAGDTSALDSGKRQMPPPAVATISAYDSLCGGVQVVWANVAGEDSFRVRRNGANLAVVPRDTLHYTDNSIVFGTRYKYEVVPFNACGSNNPTVSDSGTAHATPPQVVNVQATDSSHCFGVRITWTDTTDVDSFIVKRAGNRIGAKPKHVLSFDDSTAVAGVIYNYTVTAKNVCGEGTASDSNSGSRKSRPGQATGFIASDTSCANIYLTWNTLVNTDSFRIYRNGAYLISVTGVTTNYTDNSASAGTYAYRILPVNTCGLGDTSIVDSGYRRTRPGLATGLSATDARCDSIRLTWNPLVNTDRFRIIRNGVKIDSVLGTVTSYNDRPSVGTYAYRLLAVNTCGLGDTSVVDSGARRTSTSQVSGLYATDGECFETRVEWNAMSGVDSFVVRRNGVRLGRALGTDSAYGDATGSPGIRYAYAVIVYDLCGPGPVSPPDSGWQLASPARPTGVIATQNYCDRITLTWQDVSFENTYIIRRNNGIIAFVAGDSTSFTDYPPIGSYSYTVQAINECGASQTSLPVTGIRAGPPSIVLLSAEEDCPDIVLTWTHSTNSDWVHIFRDGAILDSIPCPNSQYRDTEATAGVHSYFVMAVNECGFALSDTLFAEVVQMPQPPDSLAFSDNHCDRITLTWDSSAGVFSHYRIYRDGGLYSSVSSNQTTYADTSVICGEEYRYQVSALSDTCGESGLTEEVFATLTDCPPPSSPAIVLSIVGENACLRWNHVTSSDSGCSLTITGYLVFYAPTAEGPFYYHGFTTDTTYTHVRVAHYNLGMYYQVLSTTEPLTLLQRLPAEATFEEVSRMLREGIRSR